MAFLSTVLSLLALELGYRVYAHKPLLTVRNWRADRVEHNTFGDRAVFDPVFGWTLKNWYASDGFNTLQHGIRRNFSETTVRTGAILAVGDSFTEGWTDVRDEGTWPAHLERMTGVPVLNGAVGGYATDQIIMRAEQLLPLVRPKTLIVGFLEEDIHRSGHSSFGASKPYFTLENGGLVYHPPQHVDVEQRSRWLAEARNVLGYSAAMDFVLGRLAYRFWYGGSGEEVFRQIDNNPVGVTCALLQRLKKKADAEGVHVLLFMQHGWHMIVDKDQPSAYAQWVTACAAKAGFEVIDQFASLRAMAASDRNSLDDLYVREGAGFGHMSSKGNAQAASLLADAIRQAR